MYSHSRNVLFIHIPKSAGQSITKFFMRLDGVPWDEREKYLLFENGDPNHGPPQVAHFTLDEYYQSDLISNEVLDNAIKFAVVRNPWDRLWSTYNFYWKHIVSWDLFFKYFPDYIFDDHMTGRDAARHIKPQVDFIDDTVEILRFEQLYSDFESFCKRHGMPSGWDTYKYNDSHSESFLNIYDSEKVKVVADYYAADIAKFGYEPPL